VTSVIANAVFLPEEAKLLVETNLDRDIFEHYCILVLSKTASYDASQLLEEIEVEADPERIATILKEIPY